LEKENWHVLEIDSVLSSLDTSRNGISEEEAKRISSKIEFHYTPKHASWLNVAEIEIGVMDAECTARRIKDKGFLTREVKAWTNKRNKRRKKINWTFTKQKADKKLRKHYVS